MKKSILMVLIAVIIAIPCIGQDDVGYTKDYIDAMQKTGTARIDALQAYVKKYPDTTGQFTRLAYYWLALDFFNVKNYEEAVKRGEARLKMGNFGQGEETRLTLVLANCYAIKSSSVFDSNKAMQYIDKAIALAQKDKDKDALTTAQELKKKLSGPPPKNLTPEQKIKSLYSMGDYAGAISCYKTLDASDKGNPEIHKVYANSLLKSNQLDTALKEFLALYSKEKTGANARRIAEAYAEKAKRNKSMIDSVVNYYLEAGWLYQKENDSAKAKAAFSTAEFHLFEKYDYNKKVKEIEAEQRKNQASAQKNEALIRQKERELRDLKRKIRKEYEAMDMAPPPYLQQQVEKLEKEIENLKSGVSANTSDAAAKLEQERQRISKEFEELKAKVKKNLGL
jgi:hypothetical protein